MNNETGNRTMLIRGLKEGDHIEMTMQCRVVENTGEIVFVQANDSFWCTDFTYYELAQAKITKLDPELKKGRAEIKSTGHRGHVIALDGDEAWFRCDYGDRCTFDTSDLRNIPEDEQ